MSNDSGFEPMTPPSNGYQDVQARAERLAVRARIIRMVQTAAATVVAFLAVSLATLFAGEGSPQLAQMEVSDDQGRGATTAESARPPVASGGDGGVNPPRSSEVPVSAESSVNPDLSGYGFAALGALLVLAAVRLILAEVKGARPTARVRWWKLGFLAGAIALTLYGLLLILR